MNEALVDIVEDGESESCRVNFEGYLTMANIVSIKQQVDDWLNDLTAKTVNIQIQNTSDVDLSFLQLMEVLGNYLKNEGFAMTMKWELDDEMKTLFKQAGFVKYT
ncbi:MAG TPA: hypothetical protein VKA27_10625 [Sunxiuqinia sp.]|nr:hypothetical protein [Sunxiuqinia sp.]